MRISEDAFEDCRQEVNRRLAKQTGSDPDLELILAKVVDEYANDLHSHLKVHFEQIQRGESE